MRFKDNKFIEIKSSQTEADGEHTCTLSHVYTYVCKCISSRLYWSVCMCLCIYLLCTFAINLSYAWFEFGLQCHWALV